MAPSETAKANTKPIVLLLHGFGNGLAIWFKCIDLLVDDGFRVCAIDLPGFGMSTRPHFPSSANGSLAEKKFVESIDSWRRHMKVDKFILAGHSFGAYLAVAYAMQHPERCQQLLLVDPWGLPERDPDAVRHVLMLKSEIRF